MNDVIDHHFVMHTVKFKYVHGLLYQGVSLCVHTHVPVAWKELAPNNTVYGNQSRSTFTNTIDAVVQRSTALEFLRERVARAKDSHPYLLPLRYQKKKAKIEYDGGGDLSRL